MNIDSRINQFRVASRELFNQFFRVEDPYHHDQAWILQERHSDLETLLFQKMVLEPEGLPTLVYGEVHPRIAVSVRMGDTAPMLLNRGIDSGYWDHAQREVAQDAKLAFIKFFDWDQLDYRDNRYVRVQILEWPSHPDLAGKHALIETLYVRFSV